MPEYAIYVKKTPIKRGPDEIVWHLFDPEPSSGVTVTLCEQFLVDESAVSVPLEQWIESSYKCQRCDERVGDDIVRAPLSSL